MGLLSGRLASLCTELGMRCVILTSNRSFCGTQDRIRGFEDFLAAHDPSAAVLETCEVPLDSERIGYESIYAAAAAQMRRHPDMNAFYVTNGLTQWAAAAVEDAGAQGAIQVFGYERTAWTEALLRAGVIGASVCQDPARQWYQAVMRMHEHLTGARPVMDPILPAECRILIQESLPFVRFDRTTGL